MNFLKLHAFVGWVLLGAAALAVVTGWQPGSPEARPVPASVRDNPGSARPIYATYRAPIPRGGGWGGGYRSGK